MREIIEKNTENQSDKRWDQLKAKMQEAYKTQINDEKFNEEKLEFILKETTTSKNPHTSKKTK